MQLGLIAGLIEPLLEAVGIPLPGLDTLVAFDCHPTVRHRASSLAEIVDTNLAMYRSWVLGAQKRHCAVQLLSRYVVKHFA